jgi:hypothetical protein
MRPVFGRERMADSAGLFLDRLPTVDEHVAVEHELADAPAFHHVARVAHD